MYRGVRRAALGTLTAAVVTMPFVAAWRHETTQHTVSARIPAAGPEAYPWTSDDDREAHAWAPPADPAHRSAPVVLAYHDIDPERTSAYTLTPAQLDAQLSALQAAGYRALSTEEFTRYLTTGRSPAPRSVYLTFDDGTRGLWTYADRILARHRMRAASYLISGRVGTHRPYYLSWSEIGRMARTGRWDFQDHTHLSHSRAAVDAAGHRGSVLANRLWKKDERRLETESEYRARVGHDLDRSLRAFARHELPRPRLFAYPFSGTEADGDRAGRDTTTLERLLRERFDSTLTNASAGRLPAGPRAAAAGQVERLEVLRTTTRSAFLEQLGEWTSRTPGEVPEPLRHGGQWRFSGRAPGGRLAALTGEGLDQGTYVSGALLPMATANWSTYRVTARVDRLLGQDSSASIEVGHGSPDPLFLTVSKTGLRVTERPGGAARRVTARRRLRPSTGRTVTLRVTPKAVRITVDGTTLVVRTTRRPDRARTDGGLSLAVRNERADTDWPRFTSLRVSP
ncbi:polysaccharide deacetylase family protein [Streptomyces mangrovisoli]|uniref:polysaccharide deacetylase family protein n=1 Tax=Streptomyces mangrovisoli TaxID=1428628 RepID=UPI001F0A3F9F|nr:polysaccharide deacetylase family protein [Streptomyces mangrovisoli]